MPHERNEALRASTCPHCHQSLDAATAIEGEAQPSPGDYSLCAYCGRWLRYTAQFKLMPATFEEVSAGMTPREMTALRIGEATVRGLIRARAEQKAAAN